MWEKVAPVDRRPESQTSAPLVASLVVECGDPSQFQVTFSPGATVTVEGLKEKPGPTLTVWSARARAGAAARAAARRIEMRKIAETYRASPGRETP